MRAEDDLRGALRSLERHAPDADALLLRMPRSPRRRPLADGTGPAGCG